MSNGNRWTANNIPDQHGKVAIVTGANSGIGYETARQLALHDSDVILACRNQEKGEEATQRIRDETLLGTVELMQLDLANLASVRTFADAFRSAHDRLDLLINDAGVMMPPERWETADGFEMQFGTNHLGHFALTGLLLDSLIKTPDSRVVNVSSTAARLGKMDFDNLQAEQSYSVPCLRSISNHIGRPSMNRTRMARIQWTHTDFPGVICVESAPIRVIRV